MNCEFVHLRVHSEYSLQDSTLRIKPLLKTTADMRMPALALTDKCNLFAMVKFYRAALNAGIAPIIGADVLLANPDSPALPYELLLLCQNDVGYRNLTQLVSRAYTHGQKGGKVLMEFDWLKNHHQGLLAISPARFSELGRALLAEDLPHAQKIAQKYHGIFQDRFYIEVQRTEREGEELYNHHAQNLARELQLPLVATNDVRFLQSDDFEAHEVRVAIGAGRTLDDPRRQRLYSPEQYLKSPQEMAALFADMPEALANSVEIAKRCNIFPTFGEVSLPAFPVPEGEDIGSFFRKKSEEGLEKRLVLLGAQNWDDTRVAEYRQRLQTEIDVILRMDFPGYFLIVADFIGWARQNGVPVGPGRGSGAGSLVAYALWITDIDPLEYDLLFERFLNPERISMPDFDVDFCMAGREKIIDYVTQTYGQDHVSQIITFGTMAAKGVIRDVGRVMGIGYGFVNDVASLVPFAVGMTLTQALQQSPDLAERYAKEDEVKELIDMGMKLEGLARNTGKHAGGVIIAPRPLTDYTPLYCEADGQGILTQFDKDDVEAVGLVKFDFLGLRTLTIIEGALTTINSRRHKAGLDGIDIAKIPLDDPESFALLQSQQTTAVFQLESAGMKNLIQKLQPDCFEDIIALVALFRPGPLDSGMVDDFVNRKKGKMPISYPHPHYEYMGLKDVLGPTYGVILYQEQVMQIAQVMGGYSLGQADILRRAMGKKIPEYMAEQKGIFLEGCVKNQIDPDIAAQIFDLVALFAGYGFNKSHSATYALVAYQTAWLKAHYPAEFMASVLSAEMDNTDKIVVLIEECRQMGLTILPPSVNCSRHQFAVDDEGRIVYGLGAIKGLGMAVIDTIYQEFLENGRFVDLYDLCRRVDAKRLNRRALEALIRGGALDELAPNRASMMAAVDDALKLAAQHQKNCAFGQVDLFGFESSQTSSHAAVELKVLPPWESDYQLQEEKAVLGLYLTGHPFSRYAKELIAITHRQLRDFLEEGEEMRRSAQEQQETLVTEQKDQKAPAKKPYQFEPEVRAAGLVINKRQIITKSGARLGEVQLDDQSARITVAFSTNEWELYQDSIVRDKVLIVEGTLGLDFRLAPRIRARNCYNIDAARDAYAKYLKIRLAPSCAYNIGSELQQVLAPYQNGCCQVVLIYQNHQARAVVELGADWRVNARDSLLKTLRQLPEVLNVTISY